MLLQPISNMHLTHGVGDYDIDNDGYAVRSLNQTGTHMFTSIRINHPRIFEGCPDGAFSYLELMDRAQEKGRLFGLSYNRLASTARQDLDNVKRRLSIPARGKRMTGITSKKFTHPAGIPFHPCVRC